MSIWHQLNNEEGTPESTYKEVISGIPQIPSDIVFQRCQYLLYCTYTAEECNDISERELVMIVEGVHQYYPDILDIMDEYEPETPNLFETHYYNNKRAGVIDACNQLCSISLTVDTFSKIVMQLARGK
jgi:hypothetical protein